LKTDQDRDPGCCSPALTYRVVT